MNKFRTLVCASCTGLMMSSVTAAEIVPRMTFLYGTNRIDSALQKAATAHVRGNVVSRSFALPGGLVVTTESRRHGAGVEWVTWFENRGAAKTPRLSQIKDCDIAYPLPPDPLPASRAFIADGLATLIYSHTGSIWSEGEFAADVTSFSEHNLRRAALPQKRDKNSKRHFAPHDGRSSDGTLPFFNVNRGNEGLIVAIGWTGQWNADFARADDGTLEVRTGLEDCDFVLLPGEKVRTSSVLVLPYANGYIRAQNEFRRIVREDLTPIGRPGRPAHAPYSMNLWGGVTSSNLIERIRFVAQQKLGFEYVWIDAGWNGRFTTPSPNEFEGAWWKEVGDWRVNTLFHPDDFADVASAIRTAGMKFLLWFEIERVHESVPLRREHPEYLHENLVDLGNAAAWDWAHTTLSNAIARLSIKCYRQDFNMRPLKVWRKADEPDRKGIHEIKHIMGLYRLWDALLKDFPDLIIDNCASGGRRIDLETIRRSVPLWRSDYQCPANHDPDIAQNHTLGLARWLPYNGTSIGRQIGDDYRLRSCYTTALGDNFLYSLENPPEGVSRQNLDWLHKRRTEYMRFREIADGDFYPLVEMTPYVDKSAWCAYEFMKGDRGVVLAFRREHSPGVTSVFPLGGIDEASDYRVEDADGGTSVVLPGRDLAAGFRVDIAQPRTAKVFFLTRLVREVAAPSGATNLPDEFAWAGRFVKYAGNPIIRPQGEWAADLIFNPAAVVHEGRVGLLCRAVNLKEAPKGREWSVSSLIWAWSDDGIHFTLDKQPFLHPTAAWPKSGECPYGGGFEDPRIVYIPAEKTYVLCYTGVSFVPNGKGGGSWRTPALIAWSKDLKTWEWGGETFPNRAVCITPEKINGKYWAYWDNSSLKSSWSEDLRTWHHTGHAVLPPRQGLFDSTLCEGVAAPILGEKGILLLYNGAMGGSARTDYMSRWSSCYAAGNFAVYQVGWALFDRNDPERLIARSAVPVVSPTEPFERFGFVNGTVFASGLVRFRGKWWLYYGCSDNRIAVATSESGEKERE